MRYVTPTLLSTLALSQLDRPAIVMGGAPTLPGELPEALERHPEALLLSANEHGARLLAEDPVAYGGREADYFVVADEIHQVHKDPMRDRVRRYGQAPIISHRWFGDIRINDWAWLGVEVNSGLMAGLVAWLMGCRPVVMCGFTNYAPDQGVYFHDEDALTSGRYKPDGFFDERCWALKARTSSRPALIAPEASPVARYFGTEVAAGSPPVSQDLQYYRGKTPGWYVMRISGPRALVGVDTLKAGDRFIATLTEVREHVKWGWVVPLKQPPM